MTDNRPNQKEILIHYLKIYLSKRHLKMKGLFKNIIKTLNANKLITINQFRAVIKFIEREEPFIDANREQIEKFFSPLIKYPSKEKEIPECYNSLM